VDVVCIEGPPPIDCGTNFTLPPGFPCTGDNEEQRLPIYQTCEPIFPPPLVRECRGTWRCTCGFP
jgi:hypothetical protein